MYMYIHDPCVSCLDTLSRLLLDLFDVCLVMCEHLAMGVGM